MCKHDAKKLEMDRRRLLKALGSAGVASHPLATLISSLIGGMAMAKESLGEPRNYMHISMQGGPPRWYWDLLLHPFQDPSSNNVFVPNGHVRTAFENNALAYKTFKHTVGDLSFYLPQLWASNVPRPGGGSAPMTDLLTNMMSIRGIYQGRDGHGGNRRLQIFPLPGRGSLDGLVADQTSAPIPAVSVDPNGYFLGDSYQSLRGVGSPMWDNKDPRNPIEQFMDSFKADASLLNNPVYQKRQSLDDLIENTLGVIEKHDLMRNPDTARLTDGRHGAKKLLKSAIGDLKDSYTTLFLKYYALNTRSSNFDMPGINMDPVLNSSYSNAQKGLGLFGSVLALQNTDLRTIIQPNTVISYLSESFATAEFMLTNGYSAAICAPVGSLDFMNLMYPGGVFPYQNVDEHETGTVPSVIMNSHYFRTIAACLYELISQLKAKNIFENTVIHLASEFSRSGRNDQTGSDHSFNGNVVTMFSGAIKKPTILGNTSAYPASIYGGTWGQCGIVEIDNSKQNYINIGHVTSTIADLLRVPRPMPNFSPVARETDQGVKPLIEEAKNV